MSNHHDNGHAPMPVKHKFFTPGVFIVLLVALNGLVFLAGRFIFGIGAVTNLSDRFPWGLWIGVDVGAGVALAAGGFVSAAIGHIMHKDQYHAIVRPALLTAMLGYTFVAFGVFTDIGRWYYIWHPLVFWNPNSALFEVGICVMIYLTVLYIEFLPMVCERFIGKVNLWGFLSVFNKPIDKILRILDKGLSNTMFVFIIAGVVLSSLHQSSLGTLMVISGSKLHPLWQTPILPLLFLMSAVCVAIPMIIFESLIASRSFKLAPEMNVLTRLGANVPIILGIYLAFKLGDMFIRESFKFMTTFSIESVMFGIEMLLIIIPIRLFASEKVLRSPLKLFIASAMVVIGVLINRVNNFIVAYHPPYADHRYFPSYGEISVTLGCAALLVLIYRACVMIFPVISQPTNKLEGAK